jgi:predicted lipid-binding transport protein (Tim44 family)
VANEADEPLEEFYGDDRLTEAPPAAAAPAPASTPASGSGSAGRRNSVAGALMAGLALGLRDVFEPKHEDRIAIEQEAPGQPHEPQRYEVHLDPQDPTSSFAIYRPWVEDGGLGEVPDKRDEP